MNPSLNNDYRGINFRTRRQFARHFGIIGGRVGIGGYQRQPKAAGLQTALEHDKAAYSLSPADFDKHSDWENKLGELLEAVQPRIIALAGFMRILRADWVSRFADRMVNIHPSYCPLFRA